VKQILKTIQIGEEAQTWVEDDLPLSVPPIRVWPEEFAPGWLQRLWRPRIPQTVHMSHPLLKSEALIFLIPNSLTVFPAYLIPLQDARGPIGEYRTLMYTPEMRPGRFTEVKSPGLLVTGHALSVEAPGTGDEWWLCTSIEEATCWQHNFSLLVQSPKSVFPKKQPQGQEIVLWPWDKVDVVTHQSRIIPPPTVKK
jgi:hypothetical protein